MTIDPNVQLFAMEVLPAGTSADRVLSLARDIQRDINNWYDEEREHEEELRSLKGCDPTEIAERF